MTQPDPVNSAERTAVGDFFVANSGVFSVLMIVVVLVGALLAGQLNYRAPHTVDVVAAAMGWGVAIFSVTAGVVVVGCFALRGIQLTLEAHPRDGRRSRRDESGDVTFMAVAAAFIVTLAAGNAGILIASYIADHNFRQGLHSVVLGDAVLLAFAATLFGLMVVSCALGERRDRNAVALETGPGIRGSRRGADRNGRG